jgi:2-polyprenyl-3-methyl-5-hydroxy-6-metoxy-1,4-benzoquinol methylase
MSEVQAEFDRIALASKDQGEHEGWNHNNHYHDFMLKQFPARIGSALDIGCGKGTLARRLAAQANYVLGVDLSPEMLRTAQEQSTAFPQIEYRQADVMEWSWPVNTFDCITSVATLHHVPLETLLPKIKAALKAGGTFVNLDLYQVENAVDLLRNGIAIPLNLIYSAAKKQTQLPEMQAAWEAHGKDDVYPRVSEVQNICANILPGAQIRKHVFWRYSLVWKKI